MIHTLSPSTHLIHLTASVIDAGQIISLARELDAGECKGAVGDDNQGGWFGLKPEWSLRLTLPGDTSYKAVVVELHGQPEDFTVSLRPESPLELELPTFSQHFAVYCKHMASQLGDCLFHIGIRDAEEQVWVQADRLDTALLRDFLIQRSRALDSQQAAEQSGRINPAYRVFFACQGHAFRVDRSGPELVLVPTEGKK